mmetsp:Transcript_7417/g.21916  ORF Transcript_7417/g.21916 Transcript_7417/m.21916 type:complete len:232 (+) Transcript_7417:3367-4062(+)
MRATKKPCSARSAAACSRGLATRAIPAGSTLTATEGPALGWCCSTAAASCRDRAVTVRSVSDTRAAASATAASSSPASIAAPRVATSTSRVVTEPVRSTRLALRMYEVSSWVRGARTAPRSPDRGLAATTAQARTAATRVISFRVRSSSTCWVEGTWDPSTSPSRAREAAVQEMAASFTSRSWSLAASRAPTAACSGSTTSCMQAGRFCSAEGRMVRISSSATLRASATTL